MATLIFCHSFVLRTLCTLLLIPAVGKEQSRPHQKYMSKIITTAICLLLFHGSSAQNTVIDSLQNLLKTVKNDTLKIKILNDLTAQHWRINPSISIRHGETAIKIAKHVDKKYMATPYMLTGYAYHLKGEDEQALNYSLKALKLSEETDNKLIYSSASYNMGAIYEKQREFSKAIGSYIHALQGYKDLHHKKGIARTWESLGRIYSERGEKKKALDAYYKALEINKELNYQSDLASNYINIANLTFSKNLQKTFDFYNKALEIYLKQSDKRGIANAYINIAAYYQHTGFPDKAVLNLRKVVEMEQSISAAERLTAYSAIVDGYKGIGDYNKALNYQEQYTQLKDSLYNAEKSKQVIEMQTKYETEKKEKENRILSQQNKIKTLEIAREKQKRKYQLLITTGIICFVAFVFFIIYSRFRYKQKTIRAKEQIERQKERFKAIIEAEEKERIRIAKELHDGLGQILSTAKLNVSGMEENIAEDDKTLLQNSMTLIDEACEEVRNISHNMMPSVLTRLGLIPALRELSGKINDAGQINVTLRVSDFSDELNEALKISIYRIIQEILNNTIRHAHASKILIQIAQKENILDVTIRDNGIGFNTDNIENAKGIGWKNIFTRVSMLSGAININSVIKEGTETTIKLPVHL